MLSARAGDEARIEGLQAGADDYLVKPFAARELVARVRNHLEISRLRRAAELERDRLRALLGQVPAIINFLRGPELVVEYAHPLASKAFGGRNMLGKALADALPELYGQEVLELLRRVLETGESIESKERRVLLDAAASGQLRERYWNSVYLPVRDQAGQSEGVMTFDIDVTDQVLARQQIEQSEEKFRQLVSQVQAGIAQLDLSGRFTFANDRYLEIVGRSNEELLQLHMQFGEAGGVWDRDRLSQLLSNLVANACQHGMPAMPVLIQVDGSHADSVQLEVRNGGTIPPALLPSVFEPLRQAGGVHEKRDGSSGLGLGLYITQQIALAHSGTIGVESEEDQGTRFVVVLPRWPSHDAERVFDGGGISRLAASHGNFSGKREDDSPTN